MILIGANMGLSKMTKEHIGICLATGIPFFVVFTKIDIAPEQVFEKNVNLLTRILSSAAAAKKPFLIKNDDENLDLAKHAQEMQNGVFCPIFSVSNVTGVGLPQLKQFISLLKSRVMMSGKFGSPLDPVEYHIERVY